MANDNIPLPFPIERIFRTRADIYARSQGRELSDYTMRAVHKDCAIVTDFSEFLKRVPPNAEAVVEFDRTYLGVANVLSYSHLYGTALILKPEAKRPQPALAASAELPKDTLEAQVAAMGELKV